MNMKKILFGLIAGATFWAGSNGLAPNTADACGCFSPPDPSVPIVQAGERILFSQEDGVVTAHIQVQYSGPAEEFGWLLPVPSIPEMEVGVDELFTQLIDSTQPKYSMTANYVGDCPFDPNNGRFSSPPAEGVDADDGATGGGEQGSPLVLRDTVGPFDFAVLRADSKDDMFNWLADNEFFVPPNTDTVSDPYIKPGGFFLALKLRSGQDTGDIQPIVLRYESELPMIPIILTSVAADPDMGIQVWVAGEDRAIPQNFFHTRINDALIDWPNAGANYVDVINEAIDEAPEDSAFPGHHSFITEYAGVSDVMENRLDWPGRFGNIDELRNINGAESFIDYLNSNGYTSAGQNGFFQPTYPPQVLNVLSRHLPVPTGLAADFAARGISDSEYYLSFSFYINRFSQERPDLFVDLDLAFDSNLLADELNERIVEPTRVAGATFTDHSYLTRLFSTLSPDEMTKDPVFSFNPDLPDVSNEHVAEITYFCDQVSDPNVLNTPATLVTEAGYVIHYPDGVEESTEEDLGSLPASASIETLREQGDPEIVRDNTGRISDALPRESGGCNAGGGAGFIGSLLGLMGFVFTRRKRS